MIEKRKNSSNPDESYYCTYAYSYYFIRCDKWNNDFQKYIKNAKHVFTDPVSFFEKSASDCTIPSPGLGMRSMSGVVAAPIPVDITARDRSLSVIDED